MGGLRADVNVSVCRRDAAPGEHHYGGITGLGQRTEIKNLSSLRAVEEAIKAEWVRQIQILESGGMVTGETRGWSLANPSKTRKLRGKEGEIDYRYMPDPDLPPLRISLEVVDHLTKSLPTLPDTLLAMLTDSEGYALTTTDARILLSVDDGARLDYYQDVVDKLRGTQGAAVTVRTLADTGKLVANWVLHELGSLLTMTDSQWSSNKVSVEALSSILDNLMEKKITGSTAKRLLRMSFEGDVREVERIIEEDGLAFRALSEEEYQARAREVMVANQAVVLDIQKRGRSGKLMFLVGQMMRQGGESRMEAKKAEDVLRRLIMRESDQV